MARRSPPRKVTYFKPVPPRLARGAVRLLTRTGLDWTHKYPAIAGAVASIGARQAYLDGELCGVRPDGVTSFSMIQLASDSGNAAALVFFLFDLLHLDGEDLCPRPLIERKERLAALLSEARSPLHYCDHQVGHGRGFHEKACAMALEGIVSKRADAAYAPGNRGLWLKVKCLHREEFVAVGWTDPEGSGHGSARYCSPTTIRTGAWSMPTAWALASSMRSWRGCGVACSRLPSRRCRSRCRPAQQPFRIAARHQPRTLPHSLRPRDRTRSKKRLFYRVVSVAREPVEPYTVLETPGTCFDSFGPIQVPKQYTPPVTGNVFCVGPRPQSRPTRFLGESPKSRIRRRSHFDPVDRKAMRLTVFDLPLDRTEQLRRLAS